MRESIFYQNGHKDSLGSAPELPYAGRHGQSDVTRRDAHNRVRGTDDAVGFLTHWLKFEIARIANEGQVVLS